jgi:hypothetical protein
MSDLAAYAGATFLVVAFIWLLFVFRAPAHLKRVLAVSQEAATALRDPNATDDEKEKIAQRSSGQLFGLFLLLVLTFAGALIAPAGVLWLLDLAHVISLHSVIAASMSVGFLVTATIVGCAVSFVLPKLRALGRSPAK